MLAAPLARRGCKTPRLFVYMYMKHLILIKVRTADPLVTSKFPFVSMCNKKYISKPENKENGPVSGKTDSVFLAQFPSGAWRLAKSTYLPWLLRPTREGAQGGASSAIQTGAGGLRQMVQTSCLEVLLVLHINQVIQPLFSTKFPSTLFFPNLIVYF